jgi:hypothetical protein
VRGICIFKPAIQVEEVASLLAGAALENAAPSTDPNRVTASIICFKTAFYEIDLGQSIYINSDWNHRCPDTTWRKSGISRWRS